MDDDFHGRLHDMANTTCPDCGYYVPRNDDGRLEEHQRWTDDGRAITCSGRSTRPRDADDRTQRCDGKPGP